MAATLEWANTEFLAEVEERSGTPVSACLQCHKCSTGCPIGVEMDFLPSQAMRLIHLGEAAELLESGTIWLCASCEACTARCPMEIDIAGVMDALRMMAIDRKADLADTHAKHFNNAFLSSVRKHSRVFELGMVMSYKLRTLDFFADADKAPKMFAKGKLALLPHRTKGGKEVREIFKRAEEEEERR